MSTPVVKDVALPFALLDAAEGRVVFAVSCYLYTLLGFHLHYNLSNFVFDLSLLRRPGWSRPYLLVSRTCYLVSKWTAFANIILNGKQDPERDFVHQRASLTVLPLRAFVTVKPYFGPLRSKTARCISLCSCLQGR